MRSKNTGELTMSHLYLLGVATLTLTSASFAGSDTNADLQARLEAAEARISELSAATNANWLNDARADEIRSLVHDVLADADTRASLQGSGSTASYNNGFTIGSADGNWSLKINGLLQTRWYSNTVSVDSGATPDVDNDGFETSRALLNFSGTIAGDYSYNIRWNLDDTELTPAVGTRGADAIDWAYGSWDVSEGWSLSAGQMKMHTSREWIINAEDQMAVDRSITAMATAFTSTGVALNYTQDDFRLNGAYMNGLIDSANGAGTVLVPAGGYPANDNSHSWSLRGELLLEGNWGQFDQFTSVEGNTAGTLVGIAYWDTGIGDNPVTPTTLAADGGQSGWVVDGQMQFDGSNLYFAYQKVSTDLVASDPNSILVAYGLYLDSNWEAYARYQNIDPDVAGTNDAEVYTVGINYYLAGNNAKWSLDYSWADEQVAANAQLGWQGTVGAPPRDEDMLRMQLQFAF